MEYFLMLVGALLVVFAAKYSSGEYPGESEEEFQQLNRYSDFERRLSILEEKVSAVEESLENDFPVETEQKLEILYKTILNMERKFDNFTEIEKAREPEVVPEKIESPEDRTKELNGRESFQDLFEKADKNEYFREIKQAYAAGKSISEIARDFGKGKGEVELILSLQR